MGRLLVALIYAKKHNCGFGGIFSPYLRNIIAVRCPIFSCTVTYVTVFVKTRHLYKIQISQRIVCPRCPTQFEDDCPFVYRATATFSPAFQRVHSTKRGVLGKLKLFRILDSLHVAMITRVGQRSRKAVSQVFYTPCLVSLLPTPQRLKLPDDVPAYVSSMTRAKILQGSVTER